MAGKRDDGLPTYNSGKLKSGGSEFFIADSKDGVATCIYFDGEQFVQIDLPEDTLDITEKEIYLEQGAIVDGKPNNKVYVLGFEDVVMSFGSVTDGIATCYYFKDKVLKTVTVDANSLAPLA